MADQAAERSKTGTTSATAAQVVAYLEAKGYLSSPAAGR